MSKHLTRVSEAQANAEALVRRENSYSAAHEASWDVRFNRPSHEPKGLRGYVNELRDAYEAECPSRLHRHDVDGGGTPAFTAAFEAWLWGDPLLYDKASGTYVTPFRAVLAGMRRAADARTRSRAAIVGRTVMGGISAVEAAIAEGIPPEWAEIVAENAMSVTWSNLNSTPVARRGAAA